MDDFFLEKRSALMRCADVSKVGDIITARDIQNVRLEEMDGFWEQSKGKVMEYSGAGFASLHSRIFFFFLK